MRTGANQYDLGSFNESAIIETIRSAGAISRTEIAEQTGLTQQSVSRILRTLLDRGLLAEGETERSARLGKPRTPVHLRAEAGHAVGVLVDPEVVSFVIADLVGHVLEEHAVPLDHGVGPGELVELIAVHVDDLRDRSGLDPRSFLGVGVAVPGPISPEGTLLDLPLSATWRGVRLRALLEERLDCPVSVDKDGTAAAIGERWIGRRERAVDFAYLYFGTGMGSGLILNGEPYRGVSANAGEFGQLCAVQLGRVDDEGRPLLVRECNPTVALPEIAREFGYTGPADSYVEMCAAVAVGDAAAVAAARQIAGVIALGAVALVDLLDLPLLVVGGPVFDPALHDIVLEALDAAVNSMPTAHQARHVAVQPSVVRGSAGAIGAASLIFERTFAPTVRRMR